ncbi:hypothetical protein H257_07822 [Aphanomyces astaci]|uniref:BRCT domain-containing protein n=1 Tax=Aphanomyces astaci TaxID=112090 RepID=W4GHD2_APHAT|nr:hypothetical protein H257_07822 [Aphanomyces astaci]ETV79057.1 hypothetical protein H257_07822 [Aphanomyces astaci]|eukprot:XP_009831776.1 hypothetical protein H257_07822 [Aphanomyces astaci]
MGRPTKSTKKALPVAEVAQAPIGENPAWWVYICPSITGVQRQCVQVCVRVMGGAMTESLDVVQGKGGRPGTTTDVQGYVICPPSHYDSYLTLREDSYVPLVTPTWIFRSVLQNSQVLLPTDRFSANPTKVFSSVVMYCVQVDVDPRKVIAALMVNGGGQLVSLPTNAATHVLCLRNSGSDYTQAVEWQRQTKSMLDDVATNVALVRDGCDRFAAGGCKGSLPDMVVQYLLGQCGLLSPQIVSYDWVQECVRQGRRVPETDFSFPENATPSPSSSSNEPPLTLQDLIDTCQKQTIYPPAPASDDLWKDLSQHAPRSEAMVGEVIVFARHIPSSLQVRMRHALEALGAAVLPSHDLVKATYVVCGYQSGAEYSAALTLHKPVVSMQWVAACIAAKAIVATSPPTSLVRQTLYAPSRRHGGIPGMDACVITLSGFSARSSPTRDDIQALVRLSGACYLSVLSRSHTTHLLCLEPTGEKFKRSIAWGLTNVVKLEWLVQSVQQWQKGPEATYSWLQPSISASITTTPVVTTTGTSSVDKRCSATTSGAPPPSPNSKPTARGKKGPKFQVDDALDALLDDPQRTTPLKSTSPPSKRPHEATPSNTSVTAVTTPIQLRKAIATNSIENNEEVVAGVPKKGRVAPAVQKKQPLTKGIKRPSSTTNDEANVAHDDTPPPPKARRRTTTTKKQKAHDDNECADQLGSTKTPKAASSQYAFLLTGSHEDMAMDASIVMALGGTVLETRRAFDLSCTHVICKHLKRTEKVVCGMASGKWILTPAYLKQCLAKGTFVDEAPFEWGGATSSKRGSGTVDPRIWPPVAQYWRQEIATGRSHGAFHGKKFGLYGTDSMTPPADMCRRIIHAAGGTILDRPSDYDQDTLVVVGEGSKADPTVGQWTVKGIPCIAPGFLIDVITKNQLEPPTWESYAVGGRA